MFLSMILSFSGIKGKGGFGTVGLWALHVVGVDFQVSGVEHSLVWYHHAYGNVELRIETLEPDLALSF
jgi:hypothetical protein